MIITGRGGGSIEDLWAFNEEIVARAITESPVPVISAVGHETDVTIADFAADRRASTPSNAAEIAVPDRAEILAGLREMKRHLSRSLRESLQARHLHLMRAKARLTAVQPEHELNVLRQRALRLHARLDRAVQDRVAALAPRQALAQVRLDSAMDAQLRQRQANVRRLQERLTALNPTGVLERGYALVMDGDRVLTTKASAETVDRMTLRFQDGLMNVTKEKSHGGKKEANL